MHSLLVASLLVGFASSASVEPRPVLHGFAELLAEGSVFVPGRPLWVALRLELDPGWHVYWRNPGDSGEPPRLRWKLPPGWSAGEIRWPAPQAIPVGPLMNYGYEKEAVFPVRLSVPEDAPSGTAPAIEARATWLVCKEECEPVEASFSLDLRSGKAFESDPRAAALIRGALAKVPAAPDGWRLSASVAGGAARLSAAPPPGEALGEEPRFFPQDEGVFANAAPQEPLRAADGSVVLRLSAHDAGPGLPERLRGVLVPGRGSKLKAVAVDLPLAAVAAVPAGGGLGAAAAAALALAGGFLLNLMPCVFPILSLKALELARGAHDGRARAAALAYSGGVLVSFWILAGVLLALRAGGAQLGWGFQLQSPLFVAAMAALMFALALALLGVFEIGLSLTRLGRAGGEISVSGSFGTGALAVAVATPCTAPFMGAALGYALGAGPLQAWAVFTALGLGMAAPYALLAAAPGLQALLPRPGPWMESFKQATAFPLLATVIWLVWVFSLQTGPGGAARLLCALLFLACAAWLWGRWGVPAAAPRARRAAAAAGLLLVAVAASAMRAGARSARPEAAPRGAWEGYAAERLSVLRASGRPVFVDFTAAWCVTCQVNKLTVLDTAPIEEAFAREGVALLRADWTSRDSAITAALAEFGRSGVPVYAWYAPGKPVRLLPTVLTPPAVLSALEEL